MWLEAPWTIEESVWLVGSVDNRGIGVVRRLRGQSRDRFSIFPFCKVSSPALRPIRGKVQLWPRTPYPEIEQQKREAHLHLVVKLRMTEATDYLHAPIRFNGVTGIAFTPHVRQRRFLSLCNCDNKVGSATTVRKREYIYSKAQQSWTCFCCWLLRWWRQTDKDDPTKFRRK